MLLSLDHANRVLSDLEGLETKGYSSSEIERLRDIAHNLTAQPSQGSFSAGEVPAPQAEVPVNTPQGPIETCVSNPNPVFTENITDLSRVSYITPPGIMTNSGTLKSHSYIWIADGEDIPIFAPVDMELSAGAYASEGGIPQYLLFFEVSCEVEVKLDHILDPVDSIRAALPDVPKIEDTRTTYTDPVSFEAGDLIGYTSGTPQAHNWDFGVYNKERLDPDAQGVGLEGLDERANCPYDYYPSPQKEVYYGLFNNSVFGSGTPYIKYCDF
jgi:hypothetical protein